MVSKKSSSVSVLNRVGGKVFVFDRATFQRCSVADLSPGGRYAVGVVRAGEVSGRQILIRRPSGCG